MYVVMPETGLPLPAATVPEALQMLSARRSSSAQTLAAPGPDRETLRTLLQLATRVPDHGKLTPWRFILLAGPAKQQFADRLERLAAGVENPAKAVAALAKLRNPPTTIAVVSRPTPGRIPLWEQELSAGALCMNLLVAAQALGFGANWITDWYAYEPRATALLGLGDSERVAGFLHLGTQREVPKERPRPPLDELISEWQPPAA
jgi:nitroreductase